MDLATMHTMMRNHHCVYFMGQALGVKAGTILEIILRTRGPATVARSEQNPIPKVLFSPEDVLADFESAMTAGLNKTEKSSKRGASDSLAEDAPPVKRRKGDSSAVAVAAERHEEEGGVEVDSQEMFELLLQELDQMTLGPYAGVAKVDDDQYELDLNQIVRAIQLELVDSIVSVKFGDVAASIFRMLSRHTDNNPLELKTIASKVLIEQKACRELLYKLLEGGFISIQDVPRASDHAPSRTFFLWYIDWESTLARVESDYIGTMWRLKVRQRTLLDANQDLVDREKRASVGALGVDLTQQERHRLLQLREAERKCEWGIMHADEYLQVLQY